MLYKKLLVVRHPGALDQHRQMANSTIEKLMERLTTELEAVNQQLAPKGYTVLDAAPFIVASSDGMYTVGANSNKMAEVAIGKTFPAQFSQLAAYDLIKNFKASNGNGPIVWQAMTQHQFLTIKQADLKHTLEALTKLPSVQ